MRKDAFFIFSILSILFACDDQKPTQTETEVLPEIITREVFRNYLNCEMDSISCSYVSIIFPQFTDSAKTKLNDIINNKIQLVAEGFVKESPNPMSMEEIAESFIDDYASFKKDFSDVEIGWYVKIESQIIYETEKYLSFNIYFESFTGGAHPNSSTSYFVYNSITDEELKLSDIISDTTQFKQILEQTFRKQKGLKEDELFADAGYWMDDGNFVLNNNIGITEDKVIVHYNPYEIAPYSLGPTTVELDRNALGDVLLLTKNYTP